MNGVFLTLDQFLSIGKKCSHCDKKATWLDSLETPAYCDEHFPYYKEIEFVKIENVSNLSNGEKYCDICKNELVACVCMMKDEK